MDSARKNYWILMVFILFAFFSSFRQKKRTGQSPLSTVKLSFINKVKGSKIVCNDSTYTNSFGEKYLITKLKYYVTNVCVLDGLRSAKEKNSYHLIDEREKESQLITFSIPGGNYTSVQFLLGVDSLHNVSGAQTDDLDPAKGMFWTWNSGYVMAKLEGNSPNSTLVNNKFEFHIGGFSGPYNVLKQVHLGFPGNPLHLAAGKTCEIIINADIDAWWQHPYDIKISDHPTIAVPGKLAKEISDNYVNMFHIEKITSE